MKKLSKIILKSGKDQSLYRMHPWVFSGAIKKIEGPVDEGVLVEVYNNQDEFMAIGHYQIGSIAVRALAFEKTEINASFWKKQIQSAFNIRQMLELIDNDQTNVYRLINGEGDNMPGLIVDFYNGTAVMQFHSIGMYLDKEYIVAALKEVMGDRLIAVYDKSEATMPFKSSVKATNGYLMGESDKSSTIVTEYGNRFSVDWVEGQKTGFFIDQRENRKMLGKYSKGRKVLNMFCYTGGFSVSALQGGAEIVHSVDSSKKAIDLTNMNVQSNFPNCTNHEAFATDAFEYLENIKDQYDVIVLDPPAFAKHQDALHNALQGYKRINQKAFEQIKPGGILFTFSCSQVVSKENFRKSVFAAAASSKRKVSILHQLSQPSDHAINMYHPEGEYLKGLVCYVE